MIRLAGVALAAAIVCNGARAADLQVCIVRDPAFPGDFTAAFQYGPVRIPAGAIFQREKHVYEAPEAALVTLRPTALARNAPCATVQVSVMASEQWHWPDTSQQPGELRYEAYGLMQRGQVHTGFDNQTRPLDFAASRGQLRAILRSAATEIVRIP